MRFTVLGTINDENIQEPPQTKVASHHMFSDNLQQSYCSHGLKFYHLGLISINFEPQ